MLHLHLISSVSCPAGLKCCSFLHPFGSSHLFSLGPLCPPSFVPASVVFCYPRKSSVASLPPFFTFLSAVSDSCLFLPHTLPLSVSFRLPLSGPVFLWWVTSRHFHASSLVHVAATPLSGLDSHFSTFSILQRRNMCPSAVRNPAVHSHVMPNPCSVCSPIISFISFLFLLIIVFCCI